MNDKRQERVARLEATQRPPEQCQTEAAVTWLKRFVSDHCALSSGEIADCEQRAADLIQYVHGIADVTA